MASPEIPDRVPCALTIAGSDSGGGAGIQADLKAFARCGVHGATAITAVTAQNTVEVRAVHTVPGDMIVAQVAAVVEDIGVDAVKIGMLGSVETVLAVERALDLLPAGVPIVVDPVMVAESGARLLEPDAQQALVERIVPRASVVTPNVPEARALAGEDDADAERLVRAVHALGSGAVVVTGGHRDDATDLFWDGETLTRIPGVRHPDGAAHGSGCTHAAALAAFLAHGLQPLDAARRARIVAGSAVAAGLRGIGAGPGPVDVLEVGARSRRSTTIAG